MSTYNTDSQVGHVECWIKCSILMKVDGIQAQCPAMTMWDGIKDITKSFGLSPEDAQILVKTWGQLANSGSPKKIAIRIQCDRCNTYMV